MQLCSITHVSQVNKSFTQHYQGESVFLVGTEMPPTSHQSQQIASALRTVSPRRKPEIFAMEQQDYDQNSAVVTQKSIPTDAK